MIITQKHLFYFFKAALGIGLLLFVISCKKHPTACFALDSKEITLRDTLEPTNCSQNAERYKWEFGDAEGTISEERSPSFQYTSQGEYLVKLSVFNGKRKSDEIARYITVGAYSIPELSPGVYHGIFVESHSNISERDTSFRGTVKITEVDTNTISITQSYYGEIQWDVEGRQQSFTLTDRGFAQGIFTHTSTGNGKYIHSEGEFRMSCFGDYLGNNWTLTFRGELTN